MNIKVGIYCFTNKINGKKYIGQSINILDRYQQHKNRYQNPRDSGYNTAIHAAFRKYGWKNFEFSILEECTVDQIDEKEINWVKVLNTLTPNGYNILPGGQRYRPIKNEKIYICPQCGKAKDKSAKLCLDCYLLERKSNMKLNPDDIDINFINIILIQGFEAVAKQYGYASGNSIKKILTKAKLPYKKDDLFQYYESITGKKHKVILEKEMKQQQKEQNAIKHRARLIGQFDLNNNLIKIYKSSKSVISDGFSSGHVVECCNGKRAKYRNYIWKYLD